MAASPSTTNGTAFVTVTAKVSIVMGIVATLYATVQVLVALLVLHGGATDSVLAFLATQPSPAGVRWVLSHLVAITVGLLLVSGAFLAVSVGLLRRRAWGWWGFVAFLVLGAAANFGVIAVIDALFAWIDHLPKAPDAASLAAELAALRRLSLALAWATAVAFGALHALIVWQLCRPHVRAEFGWVQRTR